MAKGSSLLWASLGAKAWAEHLSVTHGCTLLCSQTGIFLKIHGCGSVRARGHRVGKPLFYSGGAQEALGHVMGSSTSVVYSQGTWSISAPPHEAQQWLTYLCSCSGKVSLGGHPQGGHGLPCVLMGH